MQNSIIIMIDVEAALAERTLEGNTYFVDNTRGLGSLHEGTPDLISRIVGVSNPDGSQAAEATMNWLCLGVANLPPTLPRTFYQRDDGQELAKLRSRLRKANNARGVAEVLRELPPEEPVSAVRLKDGRVQTLDIEPRNIFGHAVTAEGAASSAYISPSVAAIRGEAVNKSVIYPAQYGSPDFIGGGWYWSATVDTSKVGKYSYKIDVLLYRPESENGAILWTPETYSIRSHLCVTQDVLANGFTGLPCPPFLPLVPANPYSTAAAL